MVSEFLYKPAKLILKALVLLCLLSGPSHDSFAQSADETTLNSAVFLRYPTDPIREMRGSGFILLRQIPADAASRSHNYQVVLITNRHMLPPQQGECSQLNVRMLVRTGTTTEVKDIPVDVLDKQGNYLSSVALHPNPLVDVAAINIGKALKDSNAVLLNQILRTHRALTTDLLISQSDMKEAAIGIGTQIYMIGFPGGVYDARNAQPILRMGVIATEPEINYSFDPAISRKYSLPNPIPGFLIDANVYPGSSGSMVMRADIMPGAFTGGKSKLPHIVGILADSLPYDDVWGTSRMGLGVVFGADAIRETINRLPNVDATGGGGPPVASFDLPKQLGYRVPHS